MAKVVAPMSMLPLRSFILSIYTAAFNVSLGMEIPMRLFFMKPLCRFIIHGNGSLLSSVAVVSHKVMFTSVSAMYSCLMSATDLVRSASRATTLA